MRKQSSNSEKKNVSWHQSCFEKRVHFTVNTMKDRKVDTDLLSDYYEFYTMHSFLWTYNILTVNISL
jgi:hypothetical protein